MKKSTITALLRHDLSRYFVASLLALAADVCMLSLSLRLLHLSLAWSASLGFAVGALVAYQLSIRWVFRQRSLRDAPLLELATFVGIGLAGLGITQALLWLGTVKLQLLPELVKLAAAVATFAFNYLVRKTLLFAGWMRVPGTRKGNA